MTSRPKPSESFLSERTNLKPSELKPPVKTPFLRWREQQRESERWFNDLAWQFFKRNAVSQDQDYVEFLESCAFFVTMTFSTYRIEREKRRLGLALHDFSVEMDNFHRLYCGLARKVFGGKWTDPKFEAKLPLAIACVDYEGSRYQTQLPARPENVHIHAVWIVHPDEIEAFNAIRESPKFKLKFLDGLHANRVRFDPFVAKKNKGGRWGGYASKVWIKAARAPTGAELIRIYPNSNYGGISYRAEHRYGVTRKQLDLLRRVIRRHARQDRSHA